MGVGGSIRDGIEDDGGEIADEVGRFAAQTHRDRRKKFSLLRIRTGTKEKLLLLILLLALAFLFFFFSFSF